MPTMTSSTIGTAKIAPDQPVAETEPTRRVAVPAILCLCVLAFAALDIAGWLLHLPLLTSVFPHYATMKPNTGICLGLVALGIATRQRPGTGASAWLNALSILAITLALLLSLGSILEYVGSLNLGIDTLVIPVPGDRPGDPVGRMAIATASCISLLGLATLLVDRLAIPATLFYLGVFGVSLSALLGFVFNAGPLFGVRWFTSMAVHTALGCFLLSLAGLFLRPEREPLGSLARHEHRKGRSRWLLPAVTLFPLAVALPPAIAMRLGWIDPGFGLALVIVILTTVQTYILWRDNIDLTRAYRDRKQVEGALFQSEKLAIVGRLSASIAHEIKNPLETVNMFMYLIRTSDSLDEARNFASTAETELERINHITTQTLAFSRDTRNNTLCDPAEIAESALRLLVSRIKATNVTVSRDFGQATGHFNTNPGELRQVLINLLSNALDATPPRGTLAIRVRRSRSWLSPRSADRVPGIRILIADSGSGISTDVRRHIFEPFFTTKLETGNGLGLWVAKNLVEKLGGTLKLHSSTIPGASGSAFAIFLPEAGDAHTRA